MITCISVTERIVVCSKMTKQAVIVERSEKSRVLVAKREAVSSHRECKSYSVERFQLSVWRYQRCFSASNYV